MKPFNKKKIVWSTLALLGLIGTLAVYQIKQDARAQTASINSILDSLLQGDCKIQVERCNHPSKEMPHPITIDVNQELQALVTQLKQLKYQTQFEPGVPACGDRVLLISLCNNEYSVWISSFGVFLIPEGDAARYAYFSQSSKSTEQKVFNQATTFFESLE
ncbi:hypothetical protein [uncultured Gimesia sp.]|uniref:hypothetical protein n=1 Tax=uncultured Gimesia sp. TaxID=1678688 RepID=UPI0030D7FFD6|tara:strand:+ start:113305 stop:113787 length:483 start_codon:yes stop_codon:yes gene_type:complete